MRFQRVRIDRYGALRDLDTGPEPLGALVVVTGPNEAGKTTFFSFLTTLLYGFKPANREDHPYTPWGGGDPEGGARILLDTGEEVEVRRDLASRPRGKLVAGVQERDIRNAHLPGLEHVPRRIFERVFALSLNELSALEGKSLEEIQDRLTMSMGTRDLRGAAEVVAELEEEAKRLWRPDGRGKPLVRDLEKRLRELRQEARTAREREKEVRNLEKALAGKEEEQRRLLKEREGLDHALRLASLHRRLRRIRELEEAAGPEEELEGLPPDPAEHLKTLETREEELTARLQQVQEEMEEAEGEARAFTEAQAALAEREVEAGDLIRDAIRVAERERGMEELRQRIRGAEEAVRERVRELFEAEWEALEPERILRISALEVQGAVDALRRAREHAHAIAQARALAPRGGPGVWAAALLLGLALLLGSVGAVRGDALLLGAGGTLLVVAAALFLTGRRRAVAVVAEGEEGGDEGAGEVPSPEEAARTLETLFEGLPLRPLLRSDPPPNLPDRLAALQKDVEELEQASSRLAEIEGEVARLRERLATFAGKVGLSLPRDLEETGDFLRRSLERACTARERAAEARSKLERARRRREAIRESLEELRRERGGLTERLAALGGGEAEEGIRRVRERMAARVKAENLRAEVEEDHPDHLDGLVAEIRKAEAEGADWTLDNDALERARHRREEVEEREKAVAQEIGTLRTRLEGSREHPSPGEVEGEREAVEEERERALRARDRLFLLARILSHAEFEFRSRHQPELVRRAGSYMEEITDGRYRRFLVGSEEDAFVLADPEREKGRALQEPLSRGSLDQAYLALRLAMMDALDEGGERLPLFVDEALVNWDPRRLERGLDLLGRIAERRQVFVFTCHPDLADALEERGARIVHLPGPS